MTTSNASLIQRIQAAVAASPELQKQLAAAQSVDQAAKPLSNALAAPVTTADLQGLHDTAAQEMSDEQLQAVAAGGIGKEQIPGILASIFIPANCAVLSAAAEIFAKKSGGCKVLFGN